MTSRLLATLGLVALMAGHAPAQDSAKKTSPIKGQVKEALEAANDDIPKAISILEKALKTAPEDRDALYLLGAMTVVQGDKSDAKADKIANFKKSTDAFAKLQKTYKDLTPYEKTFLGRSRIGEARGLALEGKPDAALDVIKKALAGGFDDVGSLEETKDLDAVRKLPGYKLAVEDAVRAGIAQEMASFQSFPFDFNLKDTDEKPVKLADFLGKVTIVDIWGTWCPPCRQEIPHFVDLYKQYQDKGFAIVGINCNEQGSPDEVRKKIKEFAKETKITYPCVLNDEKTEEKVPGFQGYPTTLFLDRTGKVRMTLVGYTAKSKLEAIITTLLAETPKAH